jgi:hypothetical protein
VAGATITNLTLTGTTISSTNNRVGALIGEASEVTIDDVAVSGANLTGANDVGGLIGYLRDDCVSSSIQDVTVSGTVTGSGTEAEEGAAGGVIGYASTESADGFPVGILTLNRVSSSAAVTGFDTVGGLIGWLRSGAGTSLAELTPVSVTDAHATGAVTGVLRTGGLIGLIEIYGATNATGRSTVSLSGVSAAGDVTKAAESLNETQGVGGLVGLADVVNSAHLAITNAHASGDVTSAKSSVGGLVGSITVRNPDVATVPSVSVERSSASGDVSGAGYTGGLIGALEHGHFGFGNQPVPGRGTTRVVTSYASGDVSGSTLVGGLIGVAMNLSGGTDTFIFEDVYASGDVAATSISVGGLVGGVGDRATLDRTYSSGVVASSSSSEIGGLVGVAGSTGTTVTNSFWDTQTSGRSTSAGGTGSTTAEMRTRTTFSGAGWSIVEGTTGTEVWGICVGGSYPFLMWQTSRPAGAPGSDPCATPSPTPTPPKPGTDPGTPIDGDSSGGTSSTTPTTTTVPPEGTFAPIPVDGELPALAPGEVAVYEDGQAVTVEILVENDTELVVRATTFELRLSGDCSGTACTIDTDDTGREVLTLEDDGRANVEGEGFAPGSTVHVWLFSVPTYLGALTVGADGTFTGSLQLEGIQVGEHTLQVNGTRYNGGQRSANLGVIVNPESTPDAALLPVTGTGVSLWSGLLILVGGSVLLARRRLT